MRGHKPPRSMGPSIWSGVLQNGAVWHETALEIAQCAIHVCKKGANRIQRKSPGTEAAPAILVPALMGIATTV